LHRRVDCSLKPYSVIGFRPKETLQRDKTLLCRMCASFSFVLILEMIFFLVLLQFRPMKRDFFPHKTGTLPSSGETGIPFDRRFQLCSLCLFLLSRERLCFLKKRFLLRTDWWSSRLPVTVSFFLFTGEGRYFLPLAKRKAFSRFIQLCDQLLPFRRSPL